VRILAVQPGPSFSVHDVYAGWVEALRHFGHDVAEYNLGERLTFFEAARVEHEPGIFRRMLTDMDDVSRLATEGIYAALYRMRPHVLLCVSGFFIPEKLFDLARMTGTRVVIIHTESPYEDDRQSALAEHADVNIVNDPTNLDRFPKGTVYIPHAYRPHVHRPYNNECVDTRLMSDFCFVGTGYPSRIQFFESMDFGEADVFFAGNWKMLHDRSPLLPYVQHRTSECLDNEQAAIVYRLSRVGINLYRREANRPELSTGWAMGPREVEMAACGLFFLREPRGEGDEVLSSLPTFETPEQASFLLAEWLARPDWRQTAVEKAYAAIADRTFVNHAALLLRRLDKGE
jgi:spore maturation protein CgeB